MAKLKKISKKATERGFSQKKLLLHSTLKTNKITIISQITSSLEGLYSARLGKINICNVSPK